MRGTSKWAKRQGKRHQAVAYGCYLPDDDPDPRDVERDGAEVEKREEAERRRESAAAIRAIDRQTKGAALVGEWVPSK